MPELPEVETIARQLRDRGIEGREILAVRIDWPRMVEPLKPKDFTQSICGTKIKKVGRTGKWIHIELNSGQHWMIHLRMAGSFSKKRSKFDRAEVLLTGGVKLYFRDTRKFGRWKLVDNPQEILGKLGPDALSPYSTSSYLDSVLTQRQRVNWLSFHLAGVPLLVRFFSGLRFVRSIHRNVGGGGVTPPSLTISICENFEPIFPLKMIP